MDTLVTTRDTGKDLYEDLKVQNLIKNRPMLSGWMDKLVYEHVREAVKHINLERPPYNPYLYETLLSDVSKLLDRCLAYRRECYDLEAQGVRRALEYDLFRDMSAQEEALLRLVTSTDAIEAQETAQNRAADEFARVRDLGKGFEALYRGGAIALHLMKENQEERGNVLLNRLTLLRAHQELLEARHTTAGHALNYGERRERIVELLVQDISEAYQKARAASAGLRSQLNLNENRDFPFPTIHSDGEKKKDVRFLDDFVLWARDMIRRYELETMKEVQFERIIPLVSPWHYGPDRSLRTPAEFSTAMQTTQGLVAFSLKGVIPPTLERPRIRGVALSAPYMASDVSTVGTTFAWSAVIFLPDQKDPYGETMPWRKRPKAAPPISRSAVVLGRIPVFQGDSPPQFASGDEVWNADPEGSADDDQWIILVDPVVNQSPQIAQPVVRRYDLLRELKLHIRLVAFPKPRGDWGAW
jgi:hypothetical protein